MLGNSSGAIQGSVPLMFPLTKVEAFFLDRPRSPILTTGRFRSRRSHRRLSHFCRRRQWKHHSRSCSRYCRLQHNQHMRPLHFSRHRHWSQHAKTCVAASSVTQGTQQFFTTVPAQQQHVSSSTHAGVATAQKHGWQRIRMVGKQW